MCYFPVLYHRYIAYIFKMKNLWKSVNSKNITVLIWWVFYRNNEHNKVFFLTLKWAVTADFWKTVTLIVLLNMMTVGDLFNGAKITTEFETFESKLGHCDWYELPIETQRNSLNECIWFSYYVEYSGTDTHIQLWSHIHFKLN